MQPDDFAATFAVSRETIARLSIYERLLQEHGKTLSLVSRSTLDDVWHRHFADSAQLLSLIHCDEACLDMGTGAGFPGLVLAIMGQGNMHLSDNNQKKCDFLAEVARETGTRVTIHNCKVEAVPAIGFQTVMARALTALDPLLALSSRFFGPATQGLFLKGQSYASERDAALHHWNFECSTHSSLTNLDSAILRVTRLNRPDYAKPSSGKHLTARGFT